MSWSNLSRARMRLVAWGRGWTSCWLNLILPTPPLFSPLQIRFSSIMILMFLSDFNLLKIWYYHVSSAAAHEGRLLLWQRCKNLLLLWRYPMFFRSFSCITFVYSFPYTSFVYIIRKIAWVSVLIVFLAILCCLSCKYSFLK